jgi:thymidylate synthase
MLPLLRTISANNRGTYFSRMITWPGKEPGGVNQLAARIQRLRAEHKAARHTHNALDIDVAADALAGGEDLRGLQVYAATDRRIRSFPCLTHIDLTLHQGRLHAVAVYRHQYLIDKAYGNLLGLSWLMQFLCQQTGYSLGELVVHATLADSQGRPRALALVREAREAARSAALTPAGGQL